MCSDYSAMPVVIFYYPLTQTATVPVSLAVARHSPLQLAWSAVVAWQLETAGARSCRAVGRDVADACSHCRMTRQGTASSGPDIPSVRFVARPRADWNQLAGLGGLTATRLTYVQRLV